MEFLNVDAHISLQLYHTNDAQAFFELLHKNKAHLRPWINWVDAINSLQDAQQLISARIKSLRARIYKFIYCARPKNNWQYRHV